MAGVGDLGSNASRVASTAAELCSLIGAGWDCWGISTPTGYLLEVFEFSQDNTTRKRESCSSYLLLPGENVWRYQTRGVLYALGLVFCFIGLATITALYMRAMEMIVKQTRKVSRKNPVTGIVEVQHEKIWNSTVADITLLALGTSSPQISLAIIDSIQHLGDLYIEGLGPGTLVGSAAFNLLPTLAICVLVPVGGTVKRIEKTRVFAVELTWSIWAYIWLYIMLKVSSPDEVSLWEALLTVLQFPLLILHAYAEDRNCPYISISFWTRKVLNWAQETGGNDLKQNQNFSPDDSYDDSGSRDDDRVESPSANQPQLTGNIQTNPSDSVFLHDNYLMSEAGPEQEISVREQWRSQLHTAMTVKVLRDENGKEIVPPFTQLLWHMITFFWRVLFAFIPPTSFGHGWPAFFCALICIAGISTFTIQLANLFGCVSGINRYAISIIVLASGSSFPDLIASKIAVERGNTADSGIANINTSNCINVFVGIGVPWLLQVCYNRIKYGQGLGTETKGLSFSVTVYFAVFTLCWLWVFFRRYHFGGELGGPRNWARASSAFFLSLWVLFVLLSCLRVYNLI
ncbi:magnesium/proton exchanger [Marchantia polymorpha subsp. ruderalis]|uniref:Sodium/calcium exchanger membrane region domain-containing protein n=2 Tax=Marchantia polymorpha TaxID=3197 RepID=A0AAF6BK67_MARPO|nr:hypothetical protein MARPO_0134s0038 [Marchantia polymorpha]BBN12401.1 hypothetical protein Mp_5g19790 [Marchantia polymorpha subsp. ruderalis]|eukprot:PTQ29828.1 hypothetical protein MARPO_0134s0038 [Marchantia polymorpha]